MRFKKIMYVHGFASSGLSGTVECLHKYLHGVEIVAPDLPVNPQEALALLHETAEREQPEAIIGTSMGAMYTQQLRGFHRILVNPSFEMSEHLKKRGFGKTPFLSPRRDGAKDFMVDGNLVKQFHEMEQTQFDGITSADDALVYGLFGTNDPVAHCAEEFCQHYTRCIFFEGEHRMNDNIVHESLLPVLRWIDDDLHGMEKMRLLIQFDTLQEEGGVKAFRVLAERFDTFIVCHAPWNAPEQWGAKVAWVQSALGVSAYDRLIFTPHKNFLKGDFLIDSSQSEDAADFEGFLIPFGEIPYQSWQQVLVYFENL